MPSRKRSAKSPAQAPSSNKQRDDRARQRASVRDQAQHGQDLRDQARRDQELLDGTVRNKAIAAKGFHQKNLLSSITEFNTASSPFLRLPAEIRNIVYDYFFEGTRYQFDQHVFNGCCYDGEGPGNYLGLFLASRQLYNETSLLLYKLSVFKFDLDVTEDCPYGEYDPDCEYGHCIALRDFLRGRSAKQMEAIAKIEVTVSYTGDIISNETRTGGEWSKELREW